MTITAERPATGCLPPILVDHLLDQPDRIRELARNNGPYFQPGRYLIDGAAAGDAGSGRSKRKVEVPKGIIGPVFRGDWATKGEVHLADAADLLTLPAFVDNAKALCQSEVVVPQQVFVNLTAPSGGQPFSHTDIAEFHGIDRSNAPGWLLQAMSTSRLFEAERITIITAVSWFYQGERGFFRYWPTGRDAGSIRHEAMWNTAVVGDNDFMHHKVERTGAKDAPKIEAMTIDTTLDYVDDRWVVLEDGESIADFAEHEIRLSLSWKAKVYATDADRARFESPDGGLEVDEVLDRFAGALDEPIAATGPDALNNPALRDQLSGKWSGYVLG